MRVVAFDIGIKNLAFCVLERAEVNTVIALENINLLEPPAVIRCTSCPSKAAVRVTGDPYCRRHAPKTHPIHPDLTATMTHAALKGVLQSLTPDCAAPDRTALATKAATWAALAMRVAVPLVQPKGENASKVSLDTVHDALRRLVVEKWSVFEGCTRVMLENQPAFKNPHMKSVQILLYATLREAFLSRGLPATFHFVHAKKKVQDAPKGDAGYAERKSKSEDRVSAMFETGRVVGGQEAWRAATKKSDMADALCMTMDF